MRSAGFLSGVIATVAACSTFLGGCTPAAKSREQGEQLTTGQQKAVEEYRAEVEVGRNMAGRLLGYYGIIDDEKLVGYINQVGNYVASYSDFPERRYMFAVLKHESVNAFACPGGYVLITMGALRNATTEAELATILGHEVAHVGKRHMIDTLKRMKEKDLNEAAKRRQVGGPMQDALKARERPKPEDSGAGAMLARYLSGTTGSTLNILAAAQAGMSLMTEKGLDKELEFEADHEGVKYAIRAGYEPRAMLDYLQRLEEGKSGKKVKNLEKTHPPLKARRTAIAALLKTLKAEDIIGATGSERFLKVRKSFPKIERE